MTDPNMHDPGTAGIWLHDRSHYDRNRDEAQTPRYFDNPYGNPYMAGGNQGQDGSWQPVSVKLVENGCRSRRRTPFAASTAYSASPHPWPGPADLARCHLEGGSHRVGCLFVVSGVIRIVTGRELGLPGRWRVLDILIGVLLTVGGVIVLKNAALSGATLAVLITMVVGPADDEGVMALVESWRMPSPDGRSMRCCRSAGFIVLFSR